MTIGFLFGVLGQLVAIIGLIVFKSPVFIITGFVPVFFDNATFAVYANHKGGLRAASILTFASGVIQVLGGALAAGAFGLAKYGGWHGNFDWDTVWVGFGFLMQNLHYVGLGVVLSATDITLPVSFTSTLRLKFSILSLMIALISSAFIFALTLFLLYIAFIIADDLNQGKEWDSEKL